MRFGHGVAVQHAIINGWKPRKDFLHAIQVRTLCTEINTRRNIFRAKNVCVHIDNVTFLSFSLSLFSLSFSLSLSLSLSLCLSVSRPVGIPRACSRNKDKRILALVRRRCPARIWNRARTGHELFTDQGRL